MDTIIFEALRTAYLRAKEIGDDELARQIYELTNSNVDWWEREDDDNF